MNKTEQKRYQSLYQQHVNALTCQSKSDNTIQSYARALRRITEYFDCCPDRLTQQHLEECSARFLESMKQAGFSYVPLHPKQCMIECKPVGKGLPALTYLARYLYLGVISEKHIIDDDGAHVAF